MEKASAEFCRDFKRLMDLYHDVRKAAEEELGERFDEAEFNARFTKKLLSIAT